MGPLANYDHVPKAADLPSGAVVLALDGTERDSLKSSALWISVSLFAVGFALGYWVGASSTKKG